MKSLSVSSVPGVYVAAVNGAHSRKQMPEACGELLGAAKSVIEERGLRKFVSIEAVNEWLAGSCVEPSTQWGLAYLAAVREAFRNR